MSVWGLAQQGWSSGNGRCRPEVMTTATCDVQGSGWERHGRAASPAKEGGGEDKPQTQGTAGRWALGAKATQQKATTMSLYFLKFSKLFV